VKFLHPTARTVELGLGVGLVAFDFVLLRSGQTETEPTASEEVYESRVVRFSKARAIRLNVNQSFDRFMARRGCPRYSPRRIASRAAMGS
jgi:hypothetical protein